MATIRRAGFGTVFELEDSKVGIGTDAATHTLQALGNFRSKGVEDVGVSTLSTYQGFVDQKSLFLNGECDFESQSGTISGKILIDGDVTVSSATTFTSGLQHLTVTDTFTLPSGDTNSREEKPTPGSFRFNQDFATLEFYTGNNWATVNTFTEMQNSPGNRGRGVFGGGFSTPQTATTLVMDYVNIHSQGNALDFGNLTGTYRGWICAASSETRGVWNSGGDYPGNNTSAIIDYVTIASEGNAIDFGDPTLNSFSKTAFGSSTRGIWGGGWTGSANSNVIEYIQFSTLGDALDFGDLVQATRGMGSSGNQIRGIFAGGQAANDNSNFTSDIDFVTIASKGNTTSFGNLTSSRRFDGGGQVSNSIKGLFWNAVGSTSTGSGIESIIIASEGNSVVFADQGLSNESRPACTSNKTRGVFAGGYSPAPSSTNAIDFVQFSTSGQIFDFGDLTESRMSAGGCSDSHGGLGGY